MFSGQLWGERGFRLMATGFRKLKISLVLIAVAALLAQRAATYPWKTLLENRITAALEAEGFTNVHLSLSGVGLTNLSLQDVTVGNAPPLTLKNVTLNYSLPDLLLGHVRDLTLSGLDLEARQTDKAWTVGGVAFGQAGAQSKTSLAIPVTAEQLAVIPTANAKVENSFVRVATDGWRLDAPLKLTWQKEPVPILSAKAEGLKYKVQSLEAVVGGATAEAALDPEAKQWKGQWQLKDIKITGGNTEIPVLDGSGTLRATADQVVIQGQVESADKSARMLFRSEHDLGAPEKSKLTIVDAVMPWNEGTLSTQQAVMPFGEKQPINMNLKVRRVSANALLRQLAGERAAATGVISGILPVTIKADGTILLHQGALESEGPGEIKMPPDAVPGGNEQVALLRDILKNFHYSALSIHVDSDKNDRLTVLMTLEGQNPDMPLGRPVKVNVRLKGDVLDLVQQNLLWLINPQKFLEQGGDEKK
jgi:hypothetical protein